MGLETMDLEKIKQENEINTGDADVEAALEAVDKKEELHALDSMEALEAFIASLPTQAEIDEKEREKSLSSLRELIAALPTDQEITNMEVENKARALEMKWRIEKAYGDIDRNKGKVEAADSAINAQTIAAKNLEDLGAGIKFPNDFEDQKFQDVRREVYTKLFGVTESFDKAKEAALGKIANYDARETFNKAREEALEYIDNLIDNKLVKDRVNSPEFQMAVAKMKEEARKRLFEI